MAKSKRWDPHNLSDEGWRAIRDDLETHFQIVPIRERDLIFGRHEQIDKLKEAARLAGRHAVVYGERGVGKSSIGNTFHLFMENEKRKIQHVRVQAGPTDSYSDIWMKVFKRISTESGNGNVTTIAEKYRGRTIEPDDVILEFEDFVAHQLPIIVIDEFDQVADKQTRALVSNTIKGLYDTSSQATIVCIGVAETVSDLIEAHDSIRRAIAQVEMPRMGNRDIRDIIQKGITRAGFYIAARALQRIAFIAKGIPYYANLLSLNAARAGCDQRTSVVELSHVETGIGYAVSDMGQTVLDGYYKAVTSNTKDTLFSEVLLACALADREAFGLFNAKEVAVQLHRITGIRYEAPQFSYHLSEFCHEKRGAILERLGKTRYFKYRFREALMEPFVIAQSIRTNVVSEKALATIIPQQIPDLFST